MKIHITSRDGEQIQAAGKIGWSLMEIIRNEGVEEVFALCGGSCSCATCHIYVDSGFAQDLPAMHEDEDALLDTSPHRIAQSRLSCQIPFAPELDGIRVQIAPED